MAHNCDIKQLTIGDVCDFVGGAQPPKSEFSKDYKEGYIRLIQTRDYKSDDFVVYIPKDKARKFCDEKDIMIGRYGPPIFQIFRGLSGAYNVALMKAVPKSNILNEYLYYYLKLKPIFNYIDRLSLRTGGQTGVDIVCLKKYPILLPPKGYQQKIVDILSSLDAKIDINSRMNIELEQMAKTLFDYWFVQFDFPNENNKPYKSSGGKMVFNQSLSREIPEGWVVKPLSSVADFKNGKGFDKENFCASGENFVFGSNGIIGRSNITLFNNPVVAIGRVGANCGEINYSIKPCWITDNAITSEPIEEEFFWWLFYTLKGINFSNITGGSAQPLITQGKLKSLEFNIAPSQLIYKYHSIVNPILKRYQINISQNQQLTSLRDWLLPMLMNGQVTIKEAEEKVNELGMVAEPQAKYKTE